MNKQPQFLTKTTTPSALLRYATISWTLSVAAAFAQQTSYSHGTPTALEQQMLEHVNRARQNPPQEGLILNAVNTWYSVAARAQSPAFFTPLVAQFSTYPAVPPLAFNPTLIFAARRHSEDMITNHYFAHNNLSGQDPTARAAALGYPAGVGENLAGSGAMSADEIFESHFDLMVDYNNINTADPLGHRMNVLDPGYTEIGIGVSGPRVGGMITQDFGAPAKSYILGVTYLDVNGNGSFDAGEGLSGITVSPSVGNWNAVTSSSGGFAIPVDPLQTATGVLNVPYPVQTTAWATIQPLDAAYRQQQVAAAPTTSVTLTWSGGRLASPITTSVALKTPVLKNYKIVGTDGWYYNMSVVTSQNVKADLAPAASSLTSIKSNSQLPDFNGDGMPDLLLRYSGGYMGAWCPDPSGAFAQWLPLNRGASFGAWAVVGVADFNGDGIPDLILQYPGGYFGAWCPDALGAFKQWLPLNNSASFGAWAIVGVSDFDGDGVPDLVLQYPGGYLGAWCPDSSGAYKQWLPLNNSASFGAWAIVGVSDFDGDGVPDLVLQYPGGYLGAWCPDSSGAFKQWLPLNNSASFGAWAVVAVSDFNGDGVPDLVLQYPGGYLGVWCPDATGAFKQWLSLNGSATFAPWTVVR